MPQFFRPWVPGTTRNIQFYHEIYHATSQDHVAARNHGKKCQKMSKKIVILGKICLVKIIWHEKLISLSGWSKETNNNSWLCPFFFHVSKIRRCD